MIPQPDGSQRGVCEGPKDENAGSGSSGSSGVTVIAHFESVISGEGAETGKAALEAAVKAGSQDSAFLDAVKTQ